MPLCPRRSIACMALPLARSSSTPLHLRDQPPRDRRYRRIHRIMVAQAHIPTYGLQQFSQRVLLQMGDQPIKALLVLRQDDGAHGTSHGAVWSMQGDGPLLPLHPRKPVPHDEPLLHPEGRQKPLDQIAVRLRGDVWKQQRERAIMELPPRWALTRSGWDGLPRRSRAGHVASTSRARSGIGASVSGTAWPILGRSSYAGSGGGAMMSKPYASASERTLVSCSGPAGERYLLCRLARLREEVLDPSGRIELEYAGGL